VKAFSKDFSKIKTCFDDIFIAAGTGITTSGILAGMVKKSIKEGMIRTSLIGISVARCTEREMPVISSYVKTQGRAVSDFYEDNREKLFVLRDDFVGKGYGSIEEDVEKTVREIYLRFGIALDPTYTGKAFYGMKKYIEENGLRGKKILFWHTGGSPLFFDYFEQKR
jgi:D-cysteine desulfhydrase